MYYCCCIIADQEEHQRLSEKKEFKRVHRKCVVPKSTYRMKIHDCQVLAATEVEQRVALHLQPVSRDLAQWSSGKALGG